MEQAKQFHEKDLERLRKFRLMDDDFMSKCFENHVECTELVVHMSPPMKTVSPIWLI